MIGRAKAWVKRRWPPLRLRTILFGVLLVTAAMPGVGAIGLRVYENTLVRQTEAELAAQGAALAATAAAIWPGAPPAPAPSPAQRRAPGYYRPQATTIDLSTSPVLPERPPAKVSTRPVDPAAAQASLRLAPIIEGATRYTLASVIVLDRTGLIASGPGAGGDLSNLPEVRQALAGAGATVFRRNGDYRTHYALEWLSRAADLRLHHARPIVVGDRVVGALLLSRSPRALFRELYEDRIKIGLGVATIFCLLIVLAGLVSRAVTRPIEQLSAASRARTSGFGEIPAAPATAAIEIRALYDDFAAMAAANDRRARYLRDVAAAVSHEFKTPLAGINGAVELLQDHGATMSAEERARFLAAIASGAQRLAHLVSRLLDLARADMAEAATDATADVAQVVRQVADACGDPAMAVVANLPQALPGAGVEAHVLQAVLVTLVDNARKAGADRTVITAAATRDSIVLTVADTGRGVPEGDRAHLFEPFFTSRRAQGGTGLGLPIARSLLAASQGRITLVPSVSGAVFEIVLPLDGRT